MKNSIPEKNKEISESENETKAQKELSENQLVQSYNKKPSTPTTTINTKESVISQEKFLESIGKTGSEAPKSMSCDALSTALDRYLAAQCGNKKNQLNHCESSAAPGCPCGSAGATHGARVDLIVLIDTSGSMGGSATAVSEATDKAIEKAKAECHVDLNVTYLGVDGTWPGTLFNNSHRTYLSGLTSAILSTDNPVGGYDPEEGANAIEDLSKYAAWRKEACRAIFYISDEELDGFAPIGDVANEAAATAAAVTAANANNVTVFANHLTYQNRGPSVIANYNSLCNLTGGTAFFSSTANVEEYVNILSKVICSACGTKCKEIKFPDVRPCISVSWGDSRCDCMETDDTEVVCITVCNCYSNITFSDLTIGVVYVVDSAGNSVPNLPDGTPSVQIIPMGPICFGAIPPCKDGKPGCVSRQLVLRTRGAKGGAYRLMVGGICFSVTKHYDFSECFNLTLCQD